MQKRHLQEIRDQAKELFLSNKTVEAVSKELNLPLETIKAWHFRDKWSKAKEEKEKEVARRLQEKLTDLEVAHNFNVIKEYVGLYKDVNNVETEKPIEDLAKKRTKREVLKDIAQMAGYFKQEVKHSGEVTVIPIFNGKSQKTNVRRNDSNKKDI